MNRREFLVAAALAPSAVRAAAAAAAARPPLALVTCDSQSSLALVDLRTFRVVGSIATPPDPRAVERVGNVAVVCHTAVGRLSIVSRDRVLHVLHGFVEPRYVAAHPDGTHAFVTDSGRSGVTVIDVRRGVALGRVRLTGWARHITIAPDGSRLWVGLGSASDRVSVVSVRPLRHLHDLTPGLPAHDVGAAPDGRLWITSGARRELAVAGRAQAADLAPQHVTFGNGRAFVTSGDSGTLRVQAPDGRVLARRPIPIGSYNVQYDAGRVITPSLSHGTLAVFDAAGEDLATVHVADSCHDACILR